MKKFSMGYMFFWEIITCLNEKATARWAMAFAIIELLCSIRVEDQQQRVLYLLRYLRI